MTVHEKLRVTPCADELALRRMFVSVQIAKAGIGATLALLFAVLVGRPDMAEALAFAGLIAPAVLAALAFTPIPLAVLEQAALAIFAGLIGYLAALTGGVSSPLIVWLVLVPAEAALAGGRPAVVRAACAAAIALFVVACVQALNLLPTSRLPFPVWEIYAVSIFAAVMQAGLIASAAQDRQRAADLAAAEGAAMYRFLADNAMDLITRHSADGRIRFASPAAAGLLGRQPETLNGPGAGGAGASRRPARDPGGLHGSELFRTCRAAPRSVSSAPTAHSCGPRSAAARQRPPRARPATSSR